MGADVISICQAADQWQQTSVHHVTGPQQLKHCSQACLDPRTAAADSLSWSVYGVRLVAGYLVLRGAGQGSGGHALHNVIAGRVQVKLRTLLLHLQQWPNLQTCPK